MGEGKALGEGRFHALDVHPNQHSTNIKDYGAQFGHELWLLGCGDGLSGGQLLCTARPEDADDCWQEREENHHEDDVVNALADVGNRAAEEESAEDHSAHPDYSAENVIGQIAEIRHPRRAGDGWTEGADDGDESRQDDGLAAVFFVKVMCALKVAAFEEEGIFTAVKSGACRATDPVADLVTNDGA